MHDVLVATHGHCFDGMASAALFTFLHGALGADPDARYRYKSCGYGPGMQQIPEGWLDGEVNAILDFRYTETPRLTWYFDHHVTGMGSPAELERALSRQGASTTPLSIFYEPTYGSCTKLIADVAQKTYGVATDAHAELVRWADIIDAARFSSAEEATSREEPALQLAAVVEHAGDAAFLNAMVPKLLSRSLPELVADPAIKALYAPLAEAQRLFTERVKAAAQEMGPVVVVDLGDAPAQVGAKFVTYALFPKSAYSVSLTRHKQHLKISVGYNPWSGVKREHDIASICRSYGGGGHPPVGACSFPAGEIDKARAALAAITKTLAS